MITIRWRCQNLEESFAENLDRLLLLLDTFIEVIINYQLEILHSLPTKEISTRVEKGKGTIALGQNRLARCQITIAQTGLIEDFVNEVIKEEGSDIIMLKNTKYVCESSHSI